MREVDTVRAFLRWTGLRAGLHRGWWLVTSVYLVVDARLDAAGPVGVAVAQSAAALVAEVPAGVLADVVGRKWSLVVSHALMGTAMLATGLVTDLPAVLATQMLWGLAWSFASGADVAWVSDELGRPREVAAVLVRAGRVELLGSALGMAGLGLLASAVGRGPTMVLAGAAVLALGGWVATRLREQRVPTARRGRAVLLDAMALVRRSRVLPVVFAAASLVGAALDVSGRLQPQRLVAVGFPTEPLLWFSALGIAALLLGALAMRRRTAGAAGPWYAAACGGAAVGVAGLAVATAAPVAVAAVLLLGGAAPMTRTLAVVRVNAEARDDSRATVLSLLAQAEYAGKIGLGTGLAALAGVAGPGGALLAAAALLALAACLTVLGPNGRGADVGGRP
ncbi:MFS transporter [Pseudonocardia humida]|uniref:MFS transporter n=1 Tax=Pseudonocardia humida TaxID=2800819 RepID=A0ABT0ZUT2_9PSEU|nr:MFS transporter [Pseudonocardia humida]MCO1654491.1 MFS transporter [Pseudonocardia humida]